MTKQELKQKRLLKRRNNYKKEIDENDKNLIRELYLIKLKYPTYIRDKLKISLETIKDYIKEEELDKIKLEEAEKRKEQTNLKRYGSICSLNNKEIQLKAKRTNLERYGTSNSLKSKIVQDKIKETNLKRYGSISPLGNKEIQDKIKETNLKKYGVEKPLQSKEIWNKTKDSKINRYGFYYVNPEKIKKTNLKRYNVSNPTQLDRIKEKIKETNLKRYGEEYPISHGKVAEKAKLTIAKKYGEKGVFGSQDIKEKIKETNLKKYGVPYYCMSNNYRENGKTISKINKEISNILFGKGLKNELEFNIKNYSYDIHILNTNILLEIDPTPYHNSTWHPYNKPKEKNYHYNKTKLAKENSYQCIHIWDWDDLDKILSLVDQNKKIIYARKLKLKEVDKDLCDLFLNTYHLQGTCRNQEIRLGLFDEDNGLIQIMTFGKPRYNKNYKYELLRLCTKSEYKIVGGTEKLFKYFIETYKPESILSYCDNSKFNGNVYKRLGFTLKSYGKPNKHWYNIKTKQHITDNLLRQRGFDQLFDTDYGKGTSNEELMLQHGFVKVYDCGQSVWEYNR